MKKLNVMICLLLAVVLLAACGSAGTKEPGQSGNNKPGTGAEQNDEQVNISLQIIWDADSGRGKTVQAILDQFEQEHENIKHEFGM